MNCDCLIGLREKLEKHYQEIVPGNNVQASLEFLSINLNTGKDGITLPFRIEYDHKAKSGRVTNKKVKANILASHCPFCGTKI